MKFPKFTRPTMTENIHFAINAVRVNFIQVGFGIE